MVVVLCAVQILTIQFLINREKSRRHTWQMYIQNASCQLVLEWKCRSTIEVAISKCLSQGKLLPTELSEIEALSMTDLMVDHDLDSLMAEVVLTHALSERLRYNAQSLSTWKADSRETADVFTRTDLVAEDTKSTIKNKAMLNFTMFLQLVCRPALQTTPI